MTQAAGASTASVFGTRQSSGCEHTTADDRHVRYPDFLKTHRHAAQDLLRVHMRSGMWRDSTVTSLKTRSTSTSGPSKYSSNMSVVLIQVLALPWHHTQHIQFYERHAQVSNAGLPSVLMPSSRQHLQERPLCLVSAGLALQLNPRSEFI